MGIRREATPKLRRTWRRSLLMGVAAAIISLMLGIFSQTLFYEIARNIPFVIRQDAHVTLPLCDIFQDMVGCDAWVGALTSIEISELSLQIGQISGLSINLILIAVFSMWNTVRGGDESALSGMLTGIAGVFSTSALALAFDVSLNITSLWGIFKILMVLCLPLSGWVGHRIGKDKRAKQLRQRVVFLLPGDRIKLPHGGGEVLSQRELEVLALVAEGLKNREIAQRLYISNATVKTHLIHVFSKLHVDNRTAAVTQALALGLLRKDEQETRSS